MLPNLLENELIPYAFISVGGVAGAAYATGQTGLPFNRYKDFET
jgi:hypothetical protein